MKNIQKLLPGLLFVLAISYVSKGMNELLSPLLQLESLTIGILLGILYNNTIQTQDYFQSGVKFCLKTLLKVGIVLLGFELNFQSLIQLGPQILLFVLIFVPTILLLANILGKLFKTNTKLATLIGIGSSICGASAIVAMAPCINADDDDSVVAVSIVNFLGAIGVLTYSAIALTSNITDFQYGIWSGISLHGVAHALAAAMAKGDLAGNVGTIVKMERVVMLVPVALVLTYLFHSKNTNNKKNKVKFPIYVLYFILAGIVSSTGIIPSSILIILKQFRSLFILMAMVGMGLSVNLQSIKNKGIQALAVGTILFLISSSCTFFIVTHLF
jgi:uncharacterized integral membrane protein (TIGR00698 family)